MAGEDTGIVSFCVCFYLYMAQIDLCIVYEIQKVYFKVSNHVLLIIV
jgi:hypothetical protein